MPLGLTNAPSTFQSLMNDVFRPYLQKFVLVFFDDIVVCSKIEEVHSHYLGLVLQTSANHSFFANKKKCEVEQQRVAHFGHVKTSDGVAIDQEKVLYLSLIRIRPKNLKELCCFLFLTNYYSKFIQGYEDYLGGQKWQPRLLRC